MFNLNKEMTIGEIIEALPAAGIVMQKYFHGGCHHCASKNMEPLWLAAKLYGHEIEQILKELRELQADPDVVKAALELSALSARERRLRRESER